MPPVDKVADFPYMGAMLVDFQPDAAHNPVFEKNGIVVRKVLLPHFFVGAQKALLLFDAFHVHREEHEIRMHSDGSAG